VTLRQPIRLVYVIGEPGAGKTTMVDATLAPWTRIPVEVPVPHELLRHPADLLCRTFGVHLGRRRPGGFGGTDALSMSIQPAVLAWLATSPAPLVLAEGDRLANPSFFDAVRAQGHHLDLVLLAVTPGAAAARRRARGGHQDPGWVQGRVTKVRRLADRYHHHVLDGELTPRELAEHLTRILDWTAS
jgi:hypothetical protein